MLFGFKDGIGLDLYSYNIIPNDFKGHQGLGLKYHPNFYSLLLQISSWVCVIFHLKNLKIFYWGVMESKNNQNHENKTINNKSFQGSGWGWRAPQGSEVVWK